MQSILKVIKLLYFIFFYMNSLKSGVYFTNVDLPHLSAHYPHGTSGLHSSIVHVLICYSKI